MHCVTLSEKADLKSTSAREEQKFKQHLESALRMELPPVASILLNSVAEHPHHKASMPENPVKTLRGRGGNRLGQRPFPTEVAPTARKPRHALRAAGP